MSSDDSARGDRNVLGGSLSPCSIAPMTGFFRDGCCSTGIHDHGSHTVCAIVTDAFLAFSRQQGNDLVTPRLEFDFPGLVAGNRWCLCVTRWKEALDAGVAPPVVLASTHAAAMRVVTLTDLLAHAADVVPDPRPGSQTPH